MPHSDYIGTDGTKWPSATDLTHMLPQAWLWAWYKREVQKHGWRGWQKCNAVSERGKRIGTHVHGLIEMGLTGKPYFAWLNETLKIPEPPRRMAKIHEMAKCVLAEIRVDEVETVETKLISQNYHLHGTTDAIMREEHLPGLMIDDWKTSNQMNTDEFRIQLAIYALCWNEMHPDQMIDRGRILRVDKKAKKTYVQIKRFENLAECIPVIDALRTVWDYANHQGPWAKQPKKDD